MQTGAGIFRRTSQDASRARELLKKGLPFAAARIFYVAATHPHDMFTTPDTRSINLTAAGKILNKSHSFTNAFRMYKQALVILPPNHVRADALFDRMMEILRPITAIDPDSLAFRKDPGDHAPLDGFRNCIRNAQKFMRQKNHLMAGHEFWKAAEMLHNSEPIKCILYEKSMSAAEAARDPRIALLICEQALKNCDNLDPGWKSAFLEKAEALKARI